MNVFDAIDIVVRRPELESEMSACPSGQCGTKEYVPTADTDADSWSHSTGLTHYGCIDELRAARNTDDYINVLDDSTPTDIVRFTLAGTCDVAVIRVYIYAQSIGTPINVSIDISDDNVTYLAAQTFAVTTTASEHYKDYAAAWRSPAYCYVRFKPISGTTNSIIIYSMEVVTNP